MRIPRIFSSVYHSLSSGLGRISGLWQGHKVKAQPAHTALPHGQPFSAKTLAQWQISAKGGGEELLQLRNKRLKQQPLDQFVESLEQHYSDFYESKDQFRSKVAFLMTELGMATGQTNALKPAGFFATKLNDQQLFLLDRYLTCTDPIEFGRAWIEDGRTLNQNYIFHCVYPARVDEAPLFSNDDLTRLGFIRKNSPDSYTLLPVELTAEHFWAMERTLKSRPVQKLASEQSGFMTLKKLEAFCLSLSEFVEEPAKSQLQEPLEVDHLDRLLALTIDPAIQYYEGLDQSLQMCVSALQSNISLQQRLASTETANPIGPVLQECLSLLSAATLDENTEITASALISDIQQKQLTEERLNHYVMALMIQMPGELPMFSQLFSLVSQHLISPNPPDQIQDSPWQQTFHQNMDLIVKRVERFNETDKDLRKFKVSELPALLSKVNDRTNDFAYDASISRLFILVEEMNEACQLTTVSQEVREMIKGPSEQWVEHIAEEAAKRLPKTLQYGLNTQTPLTPESLNIKDQMRKEWQTILRSINESDEMLAQFEKDRPRTDFDFRVAPGSRKKRKDRHFEHGLHTMESTQLMRFLGNRRAATALSKLLTQSFAAYQTKLEAYRLRKVTPFLLTPMGKDPDDNHLVTVTHLPDGNLAIDYTTNASKPSYLFGARGAGVIGLETYQINGRSIVSMDALKRGIVSATEPEVTVKLATKDGKIDWYTEESGQLIPIECPYQN
ncbi:hypothetical protein [Endozoicomonas arenosclerae]|uniref:hypothetical protein n=1 Tax=Endozoicomonas arenosclerae TaxID=1633495 RepID=UPI000782BA1A|nr:hypothetical protein [Endozoicomonas arenosclerae]